MRSNLENRGYSIVAGSVNSGWPRPKPRADEPILQALIRRDKLDGLSWSSTHELALSCRILLGEKCKTLTDNLLELDHLLVGTSTTSDG